jgi:hypothetical protein
MKKITPTEFAANWSQTMKARVSQIVTGVERTDQAPGQKAAAAAKTWIARMQDPEVQKKWQTNVAAVSLEEWKAAARTLIPQRLPGGVDRATPKVEQFAQQLLTYQASNLPKIESMPNITYEDSRARMNAWFDVMKNFRFKRS